MITKSKKEEIIKKSKLHETDTGSPEVQISVLSERIDELADHLKKHPKDNHSRRGLLQMVADRRSHIKYLEREDEKRYKKVLKKLKLKK